MADENPNPQPNQTEDIDRIFRNIHEKIDCDAIRQIYGSDGGSISTDDVIEAIYAQKLHDDQREQSGVPLEIPQEQSADSFTEQEIHDHPYEVSLPDYQAHFFDSASLPDHRESREENIIDSIDLVDDSLESNVTEVYSPYNAVPIEEERPRPNTLEIEKQHESANLGHLQTSSIRPNHGNFFHLNKTGPLIWQCHCGRSYCNRLFLNAHNMHIHGEGWDIVPDPKTNHLRRILEQGQVNTPTWLWETNPVERESILSMECKEVTSQFRIWSLEKHTKEFFNSQNLIETQQENTSTFDSEKRDLDEPEETFLKVLPAEELIDQKNANTETDLFKKPAVPKMSNYNSRNRASSLTRMKSFADRTGPREDDGAIPSTSGYQPRRLQYNTCDKLVLDQSRLERDIQDENANDAYVTFSCNTCQIQFDRKEDFDMHYLTHEEDKQFECGVCGKGFKTRHLRFIHEQETHNKTVESILKSRKSLREQE